MSVLYPAFRTAGEDLSFRAGLVMRLYPRFAPVIRIRVLYDRRSHSGRFSSRFCTRFLYPRFVSVFRTTGEEVAIRTVSSCVPTKNILEGIYFDYTPKGTPGSATVSCSCDTRVPPPYLDHETSGFRHRILTMRHPGSDTVS